MGKMMTEKRDLETDLRKMASGEWQDVPSIEECAQSALITLSAQARMLNGLRAALFNEAAWMLRERNADDVPDRMRERLKESAERLSQAARTAVENRDDKTETLEP